MPRRPPQIDYSEQLVAILADIYLDHQAWLAAQEQAQTPAEPQQTIQLAQQ